VSAVNAERMPEGFADHFHVHAGGEGESRRPVAEIVEPDRWEWAPVQRFVDLGLVSAVSLLATGSTDNTQLWDVASHASVTTLSHTGFVNSVAFSPDSKILATGSTDNTDNTARLWKTL
jgi:WD40 repeat protein